MEMKVLPPDQKSQLDIYSHTSVAPLYLATTAQRILSFFSSMNKLPLTTSFAYFSADEP